MTNMWQLRTLKAVMALAVVLLPACGSISDSSKSISGSISSFSKSSSPESAYREDVRDFTAAHVQSGGNVDQLRRQIGTLATKYGITDWESNESTFRAIGAGLAKAGYRQVQVDAFKQNMASTPEQAKWMQSGYDSAR